MVASAVGIQPSEVTPMRTPSKPKALPCVVEVVVLIFTLGLLPVIVVLCQGGLGGLILQDASMVSFPMTQRWLRRKIQGMMVPAVAAALNKCGDDKMIVKSAEDEGLYMANTPADANDTAAAAKCKEDAKAVTAANWWFAPYNRLAYRNMEKLVQCAHVSRGATPALPLEPADDADLKIFQSVAVPGGVPIETMLARMNVDGFLVLKGGKVLAEHYMNGQQPTDRHLMFSVSKCLVGLLAEILVDEGRLDDAQLVSHYVPDFAGASALTHATVRNVLNMEVACSWSEVYPASATTRSDVCKYLYSANWLPWPVSYKVDERSDGVRAFCKTLERFGPSVMNLDHGRSFHYATALTDVLGFVVAAVEGKPLHQVFAERIWCKLGADADCLFAADKAGVALAGAGWTATLRDAGRLAAMLAAGGAWNGQQVVPPTVMAKLRAGGDPKHNPWFVLWGDGGIERSYLSQFYCHAGRSLQAYGIHGQHIGAYQRSGVSVVLQSSNKTFDSGLGNIMAQHFGELVDAAFCQQML